MSYYPPQSPMNGPVPEAPVLPPLRPAVLRDRVQTTGLVALVVLGLYFAVSLAFSVVLIVYPDMPYSDMWSSVILYLFGFGLPCLVWALLLRKKGNQPLTTTLSLRPLPLDSVLICVLLGLLIQPVSAFIGQSASLIFNNLASDSVTQMSQNLPLPLLLFSMALLPAIFEEMLCRGILMDGYSDAPVWYQILIPACFFGFLHMNFQQISYALPMGIFMALILYITRSIFSTCLIHFVMNGTQVTCSWLCENKGLFQGGVAWEDTFITFLCGSEDLRVTGLIAAAALLLIILLTWILFRRHKVLTREKRTVRPGWHRGAWIMYMLLAFLFLVALLIEFLMPLLSQMEGMGF